MHPSVIRSLRNRFIGALKRPLTVEDNEMTKTLFMTVAALAIALPATAFAAQTDAKIVAEQPVLDRTVTGSIGSPDACEGGLFGASPACATADGQKLKFPSAPLNPQLGF